MSNLDSSLRAHSRAVYVMYHNLLLEHVLRESAVLTKLGGTQQYAIYAVSGESD
jgi:hypothetical protein